MKRICLNVKRVGLSSDKNQQPYILPMSSLGIRGGRHKATKKKVQ